MNPDGSPITHEQFLAMLEAQRFHCAICGAPIDHTSPLDHDHETGEPRGVLCHQCNMALGWLEAHMTAAQAYLQLATGEKDPGEQGKDTRSWKFQFHFPVRGKTPWESLEHITVEEEGPFGDPRTPEEKARDIATYQPGYVWKNPFTGEPLKNAE